MNGYAVALGDRIRQERVSRRMRLTQLAGAVGVTPAHVSHWELGKRSINVTQLHQIAQALGVPTAALIVDVHEMGRPGSDHIRAASADYLRSQALLTQRLQRRAL